MSARAIEARARSAQAQERSIRVAASASVAGGSSGAASQRASRTASAAARISVSRSRLRPCARTASNASSAAASARAGHRRRAPAQCGKHGGERVGQGGEPGVKARFEDAGAAGQGLLAVLGAGELGEDRLGPLAERGRLDGVAVVGPAGDQGLGRLAEGAQRADVRRRAAEVPFLRADAGDEHLVRAARGFGARGLRMGRRPVERGGREAEGDRVEDLAGRGHREDHVRDAARGLREPGDKPGAFFLAEPEEGLDGRAVGGPLEQGGGVDRGVVGVFDPEPGGGQPVQCAWPG